MAGFFGNQVRHRSRIIMDLSVMPQSTYFKYIDLSLLIFLALLIDFSTKPKVTDRYIGILEAQAISNSKKSELDELKCLTQKINEIITSVFKKINTINLD